MEAPAERLKQARKAAGLDNPSDAARATKMNVNTWISNENGNRPISRKMAEKYAKALGCSAGWLLYGNEEKPDYTETLVPHVSWVSAGKLMAQEGVTPTDIDRYVPVANLPRGDWIALTVDGNSMDRIAPEGSVIVVNRADASLLNDRFYVFALPSGEATFKRWRSTPQPMLQPYSTDLDNLSIPVTTDDLYVVGRVRRVITDV